MPDPDAPILAGPQARAAIAAMPGEGREPALPIEPAVRPCTCPHGERPIMCPRKYALTDCLAAETAGTLSRARGAYNEACVMPMSEVIPYLVEVINQVRREGYGAAVRDLRDWREDRHGVAVCPGLEAAEYLAGKTR